MVHVAGISAMSVTQRFRGAVRMAAVVRGVRMAV
jgi:hypothetical protein